MLAASPTSSSSSDTTAHPDVSPPSRVPASPLLSFSFSLLLLRLLLLLRARTRSPTTSCPFFLCPASAPMPLPAAPYSTHYATLDYTPTSVSLFLSLPRPRLRSSTFVHQSLSRFYPSAVHSLVPTCDLVGLARAFTPRNARSSLGKRITRTRLRGVLRSFRQFNATMSHERPIARSRRQSSRQIAIPRFRNPVSLFLRRTRTKSARTDSILRWGTISVRSPILRTGDPSFFQRHAG